jgi:hypothetical protein
MQCTGNNHLDGRDVCSIGDVLIPRISAIHRNISKIIMVFTIIRYELITITSSATIQ